MQQCPAHVTELLPRVHSIAASRTTGRLCLKISPTISAELILWVGGLTTVWAESGTRWGLWHRIRIGHGWGRLLRLLYWWGRSHWWRCLLYNGDSEPLLCRVNLIDPVVESLETRHRSRPVDVGPRHSRGTASYTKEGCAELFLHPHIYDILKVYFEAIRPLQGLVELLLLHPRRGSHRLAPDYSTQQPSCHKALREFPS